jgi:hypothetical protein
MTDGIDHGVLLMNMDFCSKRFVFDQQYKVLIDHNDDTDETVTRSAGNPLVCYTDGYRLKDPERSGYGAWLVEGNQRISRPPKTTAWFPRQYLPGRIDGYPDCS